MPLSSLISLITGEPNSGKSARAERRLQSWQHKLYVATLPDTRAFEATIQRHVKRRGPGWRVHVCDGVLPNDLQAIETALAEFPVPRACLIDGLLNWLVSAISVTADPIGAAMGIADGIVHMSARVSARWILVDVNPHCLGLDVEGEVVTAAESLHRRLRVAIEAQDLSVVKGLDHPQGFVDA